MGRQAPGVEENGRADEPPALDGAGGDPAEPVGFLPGHVDPDRLPVGEWEMPALPDVEIGVEAPELGGEESAQVGIARFVEEDRPTGNEHLGWSEIPVRAVDPALDGRRGERLRPRRQCAEYEQHPANQ